MAHKNQFGVSIEIFLFKNLKAEQVQPPGIRKRKGCTKLLNNKSCEDFKNVETWIKAQKNQLKEKQQTRIRL